MRIAVFRAREDGERTGQRLKILGHEAVLAPVLEIVPNGRRLPDERFDAVIFTSAHGADAVDPADALRLRGRPCFCVGARTVERARAVGFRDCRSALADAERLATRVSEDVPCPARILLVVGRDRKPVIEARLAEAGHEVVVVELYQAMAADHWPAHVPELVRQGRIDAALHYSRRSATLAVRLAGVTGVLAGFRTLAHHCLSGDTAEPLREAGIPNVAVAAEPNEESLFATLQ